jgi:patatin-related protein
MTDDVAPTPTSGRARELRLALVCYGGVSLAIYMHGVTKELHKLVIASRQFDKLGSEGTNPFDADTESEHSYFEALRDLTKDDGRDRRDPLSVSIDVISGTSAGGINGVCLAKVLCRNSSQEELKDLWINQADLKVLLRSPGIGGWQLRAVLAAGWTLAGADKPRSPLRGEVISQLLFKAINSMDKQAKIADPTLVPDGGSLDLFVTTTDLDGIPIRVATGAGGISQRETDHAQVVQFQADGGDADDFTAQDNGALAFAARATSSFPGAFPPVSLSSFATELGGAAFDDQRVTDRFRSPYQAGGAEKAWFVDGGVLDNAPFDLSIEAIAGKPAESEVLRRLIYIQPDPGVALDAPADPHPDDDGPDEPEPGWLPALWSSVGKVKGSHSILRDLQSIRTMNARIAEIGDITNNDTTMTTVNKAIDDALASAKDTTPAWTVGTLAGAGTDAQKLHTSVPTFVGNLYPTYCRLKAEATAHHVAGEIVRQLKLPPESAVASFIHEVWVEWVKGLPEWKDADKLMATVGPGDVPYRERRLLFVLAGVSDLYRNAGTPGWPTRPQLDTLKAAGWAAMKELQDASARSFHDGSLAFLDLAQSSDAVFSDPAAFAADPANFQRLSSVFDSWSTDVVKRVSGRVAVMWQQFDEQTADWPEDLRKGLLSRYLGFPLWDSLIFPVIALSKLPQFTPIRVSQYSPLAAMALDAVPETDPDKVNDSGKLRGISLHHFAAFTDKWRRENDYLWGRLDAAELILRTLNDTRSDTAEQVTTAEQARALAGKQLKPALAAILKSESDLSDRQELRDKLQIQIDQWPSD